MQKNQEQDSTYITQCKLEALQERADSIDTNKVKKLDRIKQLLDELKRFPKSDDLNNKEFENKYLELKKNFQQQEIEERKKLVSELKEIAPALLVALHEGYLKTKNHLFLWRIYGICRLIGQPIPEFVLSYFDYCAHNLHNKVHELPLKSAITRKASKDSKYAGEDCLKALGLYQKNKASAFVRMKQYLAEHTLMQDIEHKEKINLANGMGVTQAKINAIKTIHVLQEKVFKDSAVSEAVLYKKYSEYKKKFPI